MDQYISQLRANDGRGYIPADVANKMKTDGLVEIHPTARDSVGNPAVRLTAKGQAYNPQAGNGNGANAPVFDDEVAAPTKAAAPAPVITFDTGIKPPDKRPRGVERKPNQYEAMQAGQSAHIAGNGKELYKKYSSLPAALHKRYSEPVVDASGKPVMETKNSKKRGDFEVPKRKVLRTFSLHRVGADDPKGEGVRLFRLA